MRSNARQQRFLRARTNRAGKSAENADPILRPLHLYLFPRQSPSLLFLLPLEVLSGALDLPPAHSAPPSQKRGDEEAIHFEQRDHEHVGGGDDGIALRKRLEAHDLAFYRGLHGGRAPRHGRAGLLTGGGCGGLRMSVASGLVEDARRGRVEGVFHGAVRFRLHLVRGVAQSRNRRMRWTGKHLGRDGQQV